MAPIRRYLLLPPSILLETRIYIDPPSLAQSWLLHRTDPALPSIIDAIRPLVIPKLREETERARGKGAKGRRKGGVKDTVVGDGFEVGIFLRDDGGGRGGSGGGAGGGHSVMRKVKTFQEKGRKLRGNGGKLTGFSRDEAVVVREEDSEEDGLQNVPSAAGVEISDDEEDAEVGDEEQRERRGSFDHDSEQMTVDASASERSRGGRRDLEEEAAGGEYVTPVPANRRTAKKRRKKPHMGDAGDGQEDDKKKLGFNTTYAGYSVHGRILCLIVTRTGKERTGTGGTAAGTGQAMMEDWIASTQAPPDEE